MSWKLIGIALVVIAAAFAAAATWGSYSWHRQTEQLFTRLHAARTPLAVSTFDPAELDGLPAPVQRYLRRALTPGQPIVRGVVIDHAGTFNMSAHSEAWKPFVSHQQVATARPGFVWDGRVSMFPGVAAHVHDAYVAGEGILHPSVLGLFTLVDLRGTPEVARGEFLRWAAETAWYPTALLPSQGARWQPIDEHSARVTLADGSLSATLTFTFGADGLVETVRADARGRTVGDKVIDTPWQGRWNDYMTVNGMMVPRGGEVAWLTPEGERPYWRGRITRIEVDFATP